MKKSDSPISHVVAPVIKEFSDREFSKVSLTIKFYRCQDYGHIAVNYSSSMKVAKVTEPSVTSKTPSSFTTDPYYRYLFWYQSLPSLLLTSSLFILWHMLGTKSKFSTDLIPIANQYQVNEFAASFASHVHGQPP